MAWYDLFSSFYDQTVERIYRAWDGEEHPSLTPSEALASERRVARSACDVWRPREQMSGG